MTRDYDVIHEQTLMNGQIRLARELGGRAVMELGNDGANVWSWPTSASKDPWMSPAEELARALALLDGRFEVRRHT